MIVIVTRYIPVIFVMVLRELHGYLSSGNPAKYLWVSTKPRVPCLAVEVKLSRARAEGSRIRGEMGDLIFCGECSKAPCL